MDDFIRNHSAIWVSFPSRWCIPSGCTFGMPTVSAVLSQHHITTTMYSCFLYWSSLRRTSICRQSSHLCWWTPFIFKQTRTLTRCLVESQSLPNGCAPSLLQKQLLIQWIIRSNSNQAMIPKTILHLPHQIASHPLKTLLMIQYITWIQQDATLLLSLIRRSG